MTLPDTPTMPTPDAEGWVFADLPGAQNLCLGVRLADGRMAMAELVVAFHEATGAGMVLGVRAGKIVLNGWRDDFERFTMEGLVRLSCEEATVLPRARFDVDTRS